MKRMRVGVIGSNMMDLISRIERMPKMGETIPALGFDLGYGGKGCNQAVAAAKLGAEVVMVTKVGDDLFGPGVVENLRQQGVATQHVTTAAGHHSGVAPIFVDQDGQNAILTIKDANDCLAPDDIDRAADDLQTCDVILLQLELAVETIYHVIRSVQAWNVPLILNPAPYMPVDKRYLIGIDYLIPNEHELALLVDRPLKTRLELEEAARELRQHTGRTVVVTVGAQGSLLVEQERLQWVAPPAVQAVDTTGAGDAFIGSFAVFLSQTNDVLESMKMANAYAAFSTRRVGTQKSFLSRAQWEAEYRTLD